MRIDLILKHKYPDAVDGVDYDLRDDSDGEGIKIVKWSLPDPQPTRAVLGETENEAIKHFHVIEADTTARAELINIDNKSARWIREFLIKKFSNDPDFPKIVKDLDDEATEKRRKIKR